MSQSHGLNLFSAGAGWRNAYREALRLVQAEEVNVLTGKHIGPAGEHWLEGQLFSQKKVLFGKRIFPWSEWVKDRARTVALQRGDSFRVLQPAAERELLRETLVALSDAGQLPHLSELLAEENFFSSLLRAVQELRLAGIKNRENIERAMELLGDRRQELYQELWVLVIAYQARLNAEEKHYLDQSDLFEFAASSQSATQPLFLLGFSDCGMLEIDLIQALARQTLVYLPIDAEIKKIKAAVASKEIDKLPSSLLFARALATNFTGQISFLEFQENSAFHSQFPLIEAHTTTDELRSVANFCRLALDEHKAEKIFLVKSPDTFESISIEAEFCLALGLAGKIEERTASEFRLTRFFLNAVELKKKNFALGPCLEYAELLRLSRGDTTWDDLALRVTRAGIREGFGDWRKKSGSDPILLNFFSELQLVDQIFPEQGSVLDFHSALLEFANHTKIGNIARLKLSLKEDREAHALLASVLRKSANLASILHKNYSYKEWLHEFSLALRSSKMADIIELPKSLQVLDFGEWMPPTGENDLILFVGMNVGLDPKNNSGFFLEEGARRRLGDFHFKTKLQEELEFLQYFKSASQSANTFLSRAKLNTDGKELSPSWLLSTLQLEKRVWPEFANKKNIPHRKSQYSPQVGEFHPTHFSASFVEDYKKCAFLAFVQRVLRAEDRLLSPELDINRMDEGSLAHRVLEIFYKQKNGRHAADASERTRLLDSAFQDALEALKIRYYMGSDDLFSIQIRQLSEILKLYVEKEAEFFFRNPELEVLDCEWEFLQVIEGRPFKGVIDRIDVDKANGTFMVVDYKIGTTPSSAAVRDFSNFQLYVYLDAAEKYVQLEPAAAYYGSLREQKLNQGLIRSSFNRANAKDLDPQKKYFEFNSRTGALVKDQEFTDLRLAAKAELRTILDSIEGGNFPIAPLDAADCESCVARPSCRIRALDQPEILSNGVFPREEFLRLFSPVSNIPKVAAKPELKFNEAQEEALTISDRLVFLEASAGTGKTTVLVEKVRRFLKDCIEKRGLSPYQSVERFFAITFSEKSAAELSLRLSELLIREYGAEVAAQALEQVSTIHGFCRRIIGEFPLEAGANPMAGMLDERGAQELQEEILEDLFLDPAGATESLQILVHEYSRREVQAMLEQLSKSRSLIDSQIQNILSFFLGKTAAPEAFLLPELTIQGQLRALLELFEEFCVRYDKAKWDRAVLDFNDLERLAYKALESPIARAQYGESLDLLLVDEFQDTNSIQRSILEAVARPGWKNVFVVGDAKQSIYRFRDADVSVFQKLRKVANEQKSLFELNTNFRSQAHIVDFASGVSRIMFPDPNTEFASFEATWSDVTAKNNAEMPIQILEYSLPEGASGAADAREEEAKILTALIRKLLHEGKRLDQITILFRKLSGNQSYLRALLNSGIPYRLGSSSTFYRQMFIVDGIALLRSLYGANNDLALLALLRSPWTNLSDKEIFLIQSRTGNGLWQKLKQEEVPFLFSLRERALRSSASEILREAYLSHPSHDSRQSRLQMEKLVSIVESLELEGLSDFELLDLLSEWSGWTRESEAVKENSVAEDVKVGAVQIMTVHASKGLEFDTVILPDLSAGMPAERAKLRFLPSLGVSLKTEADEDKKNETAFKKLGEWNNERELAESKRLFYVALTRAKSEQYLLVRKDGKEKGWAAWLKALVPASHFERKAAVNVFEAPIALIETVIPSVEAVSFAQTMLPIAVSSTSISELAAYQFCGEFHRRKFVQEWDDLVVQLWDVPAEWKNKLKKSKKKNWSHDPSQEEVGRLLKALQIERKERGIALHRVLERVKQVSQIKTDARLWLEEAYLAQGVASEHPALRSLIDLDLGVLTSFLESEVGRELFSENVMGYPEVSFVWNFSEINIHGTIDRLVRHTEERWVVVDYKSSILEESRERYEFQVAAYTAAVTQHLKEIGVANPKVEGFLVNLFTAESLPVVAIPVETEKKLMLEIQNLRANYKITETLSAPASRGIVGKDVCFSCPYSLHCDVGREFVLR